MRDHVQELSTGGAEAVGRSVAVVGAGSIGVSFALVFARSRHPVTLTDPDPDRRQAAVSELRSKLAPLAMAGLLDEAPETVVGRVRVTDDLDNAVSGTALVQECIPENVDVKRELFERVGTLTGDATVLASSSSTIPASRSAAGLDCADRVLVAHPGNPPHLIPVIELVPGERTRTTVLETARQLYAGVGLFPVIVAREVEGFVFNRLQGAVLREAYALVRDGVASVDDVDTVMRDGLGRRWSFMGPFETVDLNTRGGIASHAQKLGPAYERMGAERGQHDPWTKNLVAEVDRQRRQLLPLDQWEDRVAWRDEQLVRLLQKSDPRAASDSNDIPGPYS